MDGKGIDTQSLDDAARRNLKRQQLQALIAHTRALIESYDYNNIPTAADLASPEVVDVTFKGIDPLVYLENEDSASLARNLNNITTDILNRLERFIEENPDISEYTLDQLLKGINSSTLDFERFKSYEAATEAHLGEPISLQSNKSIQHEVMQAALKNISYTRLMEQLNAINKEALIQAISILQEPYSDFANAPERLARFKNFLADAGVKPKVRDALYVFGEYILALKYVGQAATNATVEDLYANIFAMFSNGILALIMELDLNGQE
ncbi:hypothetical protein IH575_00700 [Candidatus Dojkabacteria bacterium]|nr:hypothetical protein [Candidatus Dojkabacteria bacterium]